MGKKYIIELNDECNSEFKGIMLFGVTQEKQISVELIQEESMTPYTAPDLEQVRKEVWECARKIGSESMCGLEKMGFDFSQCGIADYNPSWFVVKNYSASECIEKIRQYEQEQDRQARIEYDCEEIKDVINTTMQECNVSLDEIAKVLEKMREGE